MKLALQGGLISKAEKTIKMLCLSFFSYHCNKVSRQNLLREKSLHPEHHGRKVITNLEGAGHIASEVKKQGMTNVCAQLSFFFFLSYTIWAPYPGNGPTHD